MNFNLSIPEMLERIASLLSAYNESSWSRACLSHASLFKTDPELAKSEIRSMYGGMGAFNDLVLQTSDGVMPRADNVELDALRTKLYDLCGTQC